MKKLLKILGVVVLLLVTAIIVLPIVFKDDIKQAMDDAINENLNAQVFYDSDAFSLSLLTNFPDLTVKMGNFGIVGIEEFSQDTLVAVQNFQITVDLMSVISGDQISIEEIQLDQPTISILVLENGLANYDIAKASETTEEATVEEGSPNEESSINIGIDRWAIIDGQLSYDDQSMGFNTSIIGLNHEGKGDFTLEVFDLMTTTTIELFSLGYDGVEYVTNKKITADVTLNMNLGEMKFTFKDNMVAVNDFAMQADGFISMPNDDIDMDITFGGKQIDLKSILSLIPGVYQEYLAGIEVGGEINFDGYVKGKFNDTSMPKIAANLSIDKGRIVYEEFNIPMEQIHLASSFNYPSADLRETSFNVDEFSMLIDGEKLSSYLKFKNLENYQWDFGIDGNVDLEKITKIIPLEGMSLRGQINAVLKTTGSMSDLEAERYEAMPTSGSLTINDFYFTSQDVLPQGFGITKANLSFKPSIIALNQFDAVSGNSDFSLQGNVTNYLGFALSENETLQGSLSLTSKLIDVNEFMPEETEEEDETNDTTALEVVRVPENIDFIFTSSIDRISYTNLNLDNFKGAILVRDGSILLENNSFNMLDGTFELSGSYTTKDLEEPKYDFGFKVKDFSIASAFESFETVQQYIPIAKQVTGKFSTEFGVNGLLGSDMMPLMDQMNLKGLVNIAQATLSGGEFVSKLNAVAALKSNASTSTTEKNISLKDVLIATEIKDGRLFVDPFDLNVNGQKATVGGSNTLDGKLDYSMLMRDVPTGAIGNALNNALSGITGGKKLVSDKINLNLGIGGTYDDVKVKLLGTSPAGSGEGSTTKAAFKQQLASQVDEEKQKVEADIEKKKEEQRQKIITTAESQAEQIRAEGKTTADKVRKEGYAAADKLVADAGSNPIKKKIAQEAANKLRAETDKKAANIEAEANKKADQLVAEAKAKAAKI